MRGFTRGLCLLGIGLAFVGMSVPAYGQAVHRFGLFVGANDGGAERVRLRYAESDAQRLQGVMQRIGGIDVDDSVMLSNPRPDEIERTVARFATRVARAKEQARRVEFVFYYSGHSDEQGLLISDDRYSYRELRNAIEAVDADVSVAVLDSCSSGSFTRLKGGRRAQPFLVDESAQMSGYAFLTSSSYDEASQESDAIGASFFTHYMVSGLLGAADATGDGTVTLNEVYQYAFTETLARTSSTFAGPQHPSYEIQLSGAGDLVLTDLQSRNGGLLLDSGVDGRLFVYAVSEPRLVAEFEKLDGSQVEIKLAPGDYRVERRVGNSVSEATVRVAEGRPQLVGDADFRVRRAERNRTRGDADLPEGFDAIRQRALAAIGTIEDGSRSNVAGGEPLQAAPASATDTSALPYDPVLVEVLPGVDLFTWQKNAGPGRHSVVLGLPLTAPGYTDGIVYAAGLSLGSGDTNGLEQTALGSIREGTMRGAQSTGGFHVLRGNVFGLQSAGVVNIVDGSVIGLQAAGVANILDGEVRGVQSSGLFGLAGHRVFGGQFSGVAAVAGAVDGVQASPVNVSGDVRGAQLGVVNIARNLRGVQLGVVNVAERADGITLGLLNVVQFGVFDFSYALDARGTSWLSLAHGTEGLYTLYTVGFRQPDTAANENEIAAGIGLGTRIWSGTIFLDLDVTAMVQDTGSDIADSADLNAYPSARISGGLKFGRRFGVLGGVRFDALPRWNNQAAAPNHSGSSFTLLGDGLEVFPHGFVGVSF